MDQLENGLAILFGEYMPQPKVSKSEDDGLYAILSID
jgi:hypothetical protein